MPETDTLTSRWTSFADTVIAALVSDEETLHLLREMFMAGAFAMFGLATNAYIESGSAEELQRRMTALQDELDGWNEERKRRLAEEGVSDDEEGADVPRS